MVTPDSERSLPSPNLLRILLRFYQVLCTRLSLSLVAYSTAFYYSQEYDIEVLQPQHKCWFGLFPVRSSLTKGISFDFSSCTYLDISVRHVSPLELKVLGPLHLHVARLPYSDTDGSSLFPSYSSTFAGYASFFGQISQGIHYLH